MPSASTPPSRTDWWWWPSSRCRRPRDATSALRRRPRAKLPQPLPPAMTRRDFSQVLLATTACAVLRRALRAEPSESITAVDTHAHVFQRGLTIVGNARYAPKYDATLEEFFQ